LRRARELEARAAERASEAEARAARSPPSRLGDSLEDVAWLAGAVRRVRRAVVEGAEVLDRTLRWTGPIWWVLRRLGRGAGILAHRASHVRTEPDAFEFSPRKAARSLIALFVAPMVAYAAYNLATRHAGVFLINDKHLVSGETDEYQMGGCWQRTPDQTSCARGDGEIVLIRPAWIPQTGIFSITYDEDVGVVPLQGRCELETYGIYLRTPWVPLLRGALKPVAIGIGKCEGPGRAAG
jgi:hypothetical protein